jgi:L-aspartate oxidase
MTNGAGVVRSATSIDRAAATLDRVAAEQPEAEAGGSAVELANLVTLAGALLDSARLREESRGAHSRSDFPETDPDGLYRLVHRGAR